MSTTLSRPMSRREFLYYAWGASAALLLAGSCSAAVWFALPGRQYGEKNGLFVVDPGEVLQPPPSLALVESKFWLFYTDQGLLALNPICTRSDYRYKWSATNCRFECPQCGSKFQADGTYIEGPAPRDLDRFVITVIAQDRILRKSADGAPISIEGGQFAVVDVNRPLRRPRSTRAETLRSTYPCPYIVKISVS